MIIRKRKPQEPCADPDWLEFQKMRRRLADLINRRASRSANDTRAGVKEEDTNEHRE